MNITVYNRQRAITVPLGWLKQLAAEALPICAKHSDDNRFALRYLEEIEVTFVSDRTIAAVHEQFMNIPGATDVITFDHGEIVISAQTAAAYAPKFGHTLAQELGLYIIHGLLHLNGYDDTTPRAAARMKEKQERILQACLATLPPS